MAQGKVISKKENSITPNFAVNRGFISGRRSDEVKKRVLCEYGNVIREGLLNNKPYAIVYENNGMKTRPIFNVLVKKVKHKARMFNLRHINPHALVDKPTLKLTFDSTINVGLMIKPENSIQIAFANVPMADRYKFPQE